MANWRDKKVTTKEVSLMMFLLNMNRFKELDWHRYHVLFQRTGSARLSCFWCRRNFESLFSACSNFCWLLDKTFAKSDPLIAIHHHLTSILIIITIVKCHHHHCEDAHMSSHVWPEAQSRFMLCSLSHCSAAICIWHRMSFGIVDRHHICTHSHQLLGIVINNMSILIIDNLWNNMI